MSPSLSYSLFVTCSWTKKNYLVFWHSLYWDVVIFSGIHINILKTSVFIWISWHDWFPYSIYVQIHWDVFGEQHKECINQTRPLNASNQDSPLRSICYSPPVNKASFSVETFLSISLRLTTFFFLSMPFGIDTSGYLVVWKVSSIWIKDFILDLVWRWVGLGVGTVDVEWCWTASSHFLFFAFIRGLLLFWFWVHSLISLLVVTGSSVSQ